MVLNRAADRSCARLIVGAGIVYSEDRKNKSVSGIKLLDTSRFPEKYVMYLTQPLDHRHPEKGSFRQRVIVGHVGYDRPTVMSLKDMGQGMLCAPLIGKNFLNCSMPI